MLVSFAEALLISLLLIETKPVMRKRRKRRKDGHIPQAGKKRSDAAPSHQ